MSEKSTRKAPDYAVESRVARDRSVFRPELQRGSSKTLRSGIIQANRCRKRRFQVQSFCLRSFRNRRPKRTGMFSLGTAPYCAVTYER